MSLIPERSHSFITRTSLLYIIIFALFLTVASCSTLGSGSRTDPYRNSKNYKNPDLGYRQDRLHQKGSGKASEETRESFSEPANLPDLKGFKDDLANASLEKAIIYQLQAMMEQETSTPIRLGKYTLTRGRLVETLEAFLEILQQSLPDDDFNKKIKEEFVLYRVGKGKNKEMLFTGYYQPVIQASPVRTSVYRYPIYRMPEGRLRQVNYKKGIQLIGTHSGIKRIRAASPEKPWRRFTREEIDRKGVLQGHGLEIGWLKDDLDRYFLHIQGSGILEFPDGSRQGVGYQGSNQYSYTGIGRLMIEDGIIEISQGSMQGIKKYFAENPKDIEKYLYQNKRYIFFTFNDKGPRGSGGGELVGGRSIATDKSIYPAGGLAFIKVKKPILDANNNIIRWQPISRFVVDQDTGSAIRGPGRADLFFGTGKKAGAQAGHYHERGKIYYLIKRS